MSNQSMPEVVAVKFMIAFSAFVFGVWLIGNTLSQQSNDAQPVESPSPLIETSSKQDVVVRFDDALAIQVTDAEHISQLWLSVQDCIGTFWMSKAKGRTLYVHIVSESEFQKRRHMRMISKPPTEDKIEVYTTAGNIEDITAFRIDVINTILAERGETMPEPGAEQLHPVTQVCASSIQYVAPANRSMLVIEDPHTQTKE